MNSMLAQFLAEAHEYIQQIGDRLMQLESQPANEELLTELFRFVHTLKGNSGLFAFKQMTDVLHAAEDLLCLVRGGAVPFSRSLADPLLECMDLMTLLCGDIAKAESISAARTPACTKMTATLRALMPASPASAGGAVTPCSATLPAHGSDELAPLEQVPEAVRMEAYRRAQHAEHLSWITYTPISDCFFQGGDPLKDALQTPGVLWGRAIPTAKLPTLAEHDTYRCLLAFQMMTTATREDLEEHFAYVMEHVIIVPITPLRLVIPAGVQRPEWSAKPIAPKFHQKRLSETQVELRRWVAQYPDRQQADPWTASAFHWLDLLLECNPEDGDILNRMVDAIDRRCQPNWDVTREPDHRTDADASGRKWSKEEIGAFQELWSAQHDVLRLDGQGRGWEGRVAAAACVLRNLALAVGDKAAAEDLDAALTAALGSRATGPLLQWIARHNSVASQPAKQQTSHRESSGVPEAAPPDPTPSSTADESVRFGRRAEDSATTSQFLKVDQAKIDRLMNLIGELIVAKNGLPYLVQRAESNASPREIARGIKAQHSVIHRIADEMQDSILQVRMVAMSFVFQRFHRLVRDISRKLGKEVRLLLEGEQTEADKHIIESLVDPLVHIVRNSLDHGFEMPDVRVARGKPAAGTLTLRALQQGDSVLIEILDDGNGIDPATIKQKALDKGLISADQMNQMSDREAVNLIFAPGFSTAEVISDLSGRGVGMDVVRSTVEALNGSVSVESTPGAGTAIRIALPLSVAVTQIMMIESDGQLFGVPLDHVVETVRIPRRSIRRIKQASTAVLRNRIVPLKALNAALGLDAAPVANPDDESSVLLVQAGGEILGLLVDGFRETMGIIQKPLSGILSGLACFTGSTLLGDGSVLLILNVKELL